MKKLTIYNTLSNKIVKMINSFNRIDSAYDFDTKRNKIILGAYSHDDNNNILLRNIISGMKISSINTS